MIADPLHGTSLRNFRTMGLKEEFPGRKMVDHTQRVSNQNDFGFSIAAPEVRTDPI